MLSEQQLTSPRTDVRFAGRRSAGGGVAISQLEQVAALFPPPVGVFDFELKDADGVADGVDLDKFSALGDSLGQLSCPARLFDGIALKLLTRPCRGDDRSTCQ